MLEYPYNDEAPQQPRVLQAVQYDIVLKLPRYRPEQALGGSRRLSLQNF
jgi:hypothetical protein